MKHHIEKANIAIQERIRSTLPARNRPRRKDRPTIQDMGSTVVLSMDVTALYPSVSKGLSTRSMVRAVKESTVPWEGVNTKQLGRYLAVTIDRKTLKDHKVDKCTPVAKNTTTLNSFTNPTKTAKATGGDSLV